jgi:hypothetical protein
MTFNELTVWFLGLERVKALACYPTLKIWLSRPNDVRLHYRIIRVEPELFTILKDLT